MTSTLKIYDLSYIYFNYACFDQLGVYVKFKDKIDLILNIKTQHQANMFTNLFKWISSLWIYCRVPLTKASGLFSLDLATT